MISLLQIGSGAGRLFALWLKEWQPVLPDASRASPGSSRSARLIIRPADDHVAMWLEAPDGTRLLGEHCRWVDYDRGVLDRMQRAALSRIRGADLAMVLSLPYAISGSLTIPRQARTRATSIVQDHVARKIPLKAESLFIGHDEREVAGRIELRYLILPKEKLNQILARLSIDFSDLDALGNVPVAGDNPVSVSCSRPPSARSRWIARAASAMVILAVLAPVASFGSLAWHQNALLEEMDAQVNLLTAEARRTTEQLKDVYGMTSDLDRVVAIKAAPSISQIWEELARLLPDTTHLKEVEIKGSEVHTVGFSEAAPELIHNFEASPLLHAAALTGPVVFDQAEGKEHFTLRATTRKPRLPSEERE
jgi:general secretion pathway protein L